MSEPRGELSLLQSEIQNLPTQLFLLSSLYTAADVLAKIKSFSPAVAELDVKSVSWAGIGVSAFSSVLSGNDIDSFHDSIEFGYYDVALGPFPGFACSVKEIAFNNTTHLQVAYGFVNGQYQVKGRAVVGSSFAGIAWGTELTSSIAGIGSAMPAPRPQPGAGAGNMAYGTSCTWDGTYTRFPPGGQWVALYAVGGNWYITFNAGGTPISTIDVRAAILIWRYTE